MRMSESVFVGRETELNRMNSFLETAGGGKAQVLFISGEAGAGKSSLVSEFVRRAEEADSKLISAIGECNAQTGISDPYLPFRQILTSLTTEENIQKAASKKAGDAQRLNRWKGFVRVSSQTLITLGPDLVGIFVPGARLLVRVGTTIASNTNLANKLSDKIGEKTDKEGQKINPTLDQEKIFEQYAAVLRALAKDNILLLVLDDLQWADSGSVNLLFHLSRQLKDSRVLLVGTYRPDDVALGRDGERHPLESILNELKRYNGDIVVDLSQTEAKEGRAFVNALVDSEPNHLERGFREELFEHTGGHPLFTVELLRVMQERGIILKDADGYWIQGDQLDWKTLPARIEGVISERVARLPDDLRETLTIASVIGNEFAAQVVAIIQKVNEREMVRNLSRDLEKRYLLVVELGEIKIGNGFLSQYRFSHALLQQYLYDELGAGERRMLHAETAETLESLYADQTNDIALQLAHHYEAGGIDKKAIAYLITAGDSAFRAYAYNEAISAYTRALDLGVNATMSDEQLNQTYLNRGRSLELNNQYNLALQNYEEMGALAEKRGDRGLELASKVAEGTLYSTPTPVADYDKAQRLSDETLELARELGDRASEARVLWNLQLLNLQHGKSAEAIDFGEKSLALARELSLYEQMAYVLSDLGWAYNFACEFDKAEARLEEAERLWRELGNTPMLASTLGHSLGGLLWSGRYDKVMKVADEALKISTSTANFWTMSGIHFFEGQAQFEYGEIDRALASIEDGIQLAAQGKLNVFENWGSALLCWIYGELGATEIGMQFYQVHRIANKDLSNTSLRTATLVSYALFELANGQLDTAAGTLSNCLPDALPWEGMLRLAKSKLALAQKNFSEGLRIADSTVELARMKGLGRYLPEALLLKGKSHYLLSDPTQASSALEQARTEAETLGSRRLLWQILALLAETENNKDKAAALKSEARENVDTIASHISNEELRDSFLKSDAVRAILS
jgi:predicted ATPase